MINIAEQNSFTPTHDGDFSFSSLVNRPEFKHNPEKSVVAIVDYGLNRYKAGVEGVWPSYVPRYITAGETKAPKLLSSVFRVDGLGIALLALKHAEGIGITVSSSIRDEVEECIRQYMQDSERVIQDLAATADLTTDWGHQALAEAVQSRAPSAK